MKKFTMIFASVLLSGHAAMAACPTEITEVSKEGSKALLSQVASNKQSGILDFSASIGKSASSGASAFQVGNETLYLVQVKSDKNEVVNGVLTCDKSSGKMKVLTTSWVSKKSNGVGN